MKNWKMPGDLGGNWWPFADHSSLSGDKEEGKENGISA